MAYTTIKHAHGSYQNFWPDDTDNEFFIAEGSTLAEIIDRAQAKWGSDIEIAELIITPEYIHTECLGYDCYEPGDYTNFLRISRA